MFLNQRHEYAHTAKTPLGTFRAHFEVSVATITADSGAIGSAPGMSMSTKKPYRRFLQAAQAVFGFL